MRSVILVRQLAAGGIDVLAATLTKPCIHPVLLEVGHKAGDRVVIRLGEEGGLYWIVFNDIDEIGGYLAVDPHQFLGILQAVIEVLEQDIFESDLIARLFVEIVQRIDQCLDIIGLVDRHDLVALHVIGGVEGDGQFEFDLVVSQLVDHFGDAGRGDGDAAGTHTQTVWGRDTLDRLQYIAVIQQGFAHAHEYDVRQLLLINAFRLLIDQHHFVIDLVVVEVAFALHIAGGAEFTAEGAAYLGGDTGGLAIVRRDEDTFHQVAVYGTEAAFDGAVCRILGCIDPKGGEAEIIFQQLTELLAEVGHGREAGGILQPNPLIDLPGPEFFLSKTFKILL